MVKLTLTTDDAYTPSEAWHKLGISRRTIYRWIKSGKLSTLSIAGKTLIPKSEVQRLKCAKCPTINAPIEIAYKACQSCPSYLYFNKKEHQ